MKIDSKQTEFEGVIEVSFSDTFEVKDWEDVSKLIAELKSAVRSYKIKE